MRPQRALPEERQSHQGPNQQGYEYTTPDGSSTHLLAGYDDPDDAIAPQRASPDTSPRPQWVPRSIARVYQVTKTWVQGPQPPQIQKIAPYCARTQTAPIRLLDLYVPKNNHRCLLLLGFYLFWFLAFVGILHRSANSGMIEGFGTPAQIGCIASYWNPGNGCGLDGNDCRPFSNGSFAFRCPANCARAMVLNPRAVGAQEIVYQPLVVGGWKDVAPENEGPIYRGDSYLCQAAIHAGIVTNQKGGCGVATLIGEHSDYPSSKRNGIQSVGFDSGFPLSFSFVPGSSSECADLRWPLLAVSVIFTTILSLFTTSPAVFFYSIFVGIFFHVGLGSDPPSLSDYYSILSIIIGRFLPAAFISFVLYRSCIRRQLIGLSAQIEKTILWLGGCWVGALNNYTFDHIPISRLTPHDLNQQPGAKVALAIIVAILLIIAAGQIYFLRLEGRLPRYLALYIAFLVGIVILVALPGLDLRIHHYILALLLLPGTAIQTRPSLLYQGILVGLFINGITRWGFDSLLQTPAMLLGDGQLNTLLPTIAAPLITPNNITFAWSAPLYPYDGISVLVNDVERYRGYEDYDANTLVWARRRSNEKEYFRFGYMTGSAAGDYTKAGTWKLDGTWIPPLPGPSR
ncbi:MAG: hypothetical protein M1835_006313 [Candelina submexicana]|nr:MAG: hypothetical protein M1835_006313 [Candelina submexicana]